MSLYGVIGYHVTLWETHMIANHLSILTITFYNKMGHKCFLIWGD